MKLDSTQKYILAGGAILLLFGVIYRFFPLISGAGVSSSEIALKEKQLAKYQTLLQERDRLGEELIALNRQLVRAESRLLAGNTPALAAVDIQNVLQKLAAKSEVEIQTLRILKPIQPEKTSGSGYIGIPVQFSVKTTMRRLKEILYQVESADHLLQVIDLRIRVVPGSEQELVLATITVQGYMKDENTALPKV